MARKSRYEHLREGAKELYRKGMGSPSIAKELIDKDTGLTFNDHEALSRQIRKWAKDQNWPKPEDKQVLNIPKKILLFDIETAPLQCYAWGIWGQNINPDFLIRDWFVLCWSAKWIFEDKVYNMSLTSKEIKKGNDERIIRGLWNMLDEADIVIAHNLEKFDKKRAQTRFFKYEMGLPSPYQSIDTLLHLRKKFQITSNRLDYVAKDFLCIAGKMDTPKGLWLDCMNRDMEAMQTMVDYCDQDVRVLEDVYLKLRPYVQPHPNIGLIEGSDKPVCPCCGSENLNLDGTYHTYVNEFDSYRCGDCRAISRSRKNSTPKNVRDNIKVSIPR